MDKSLVNSPAAGCKSDMQLIQLTIESLVIEHVRGVYIIYGLTSMMNPHFKFSLLLVYIVYCKAKQLTTVLSPNPVHAVHLLYQLISPLPQNIHSHVLNYNSGLKMKRKKTD